MRRCYVAFSVGGKGLKELARARVVFLHLALNSYSTLPLSHENVTYSYVVGHTQTFVTGAVGGNTTSTSK